MAKKKVTVDGVEAMKDQVCLETFNKVYFALRDFGDASITSAGSIMYTTKGGTHMVVSLDGEHIRFWLWPIEHRISVYGLTAEQKGDRLVFNKGRKDQLIVRREKTSSK